MKERAAKARHDAYVAAKERRKADPRTAELKAKRKAAAREASARAKQLRKTDPRQIALKEKLKQDRRAASEQRKAERATARTAERAKKREEGGVRGATAPRGVRLELLITEPDAAARAVPRSLSSVRAALTVIEGGKSRKNET